jgi:phosphate transport system protein
MRHNDMPDNAAPGSDAPSDMLASLDVSVIRLFALIGDNLAGATEVLLHPDRERAMALAKRDALIDQLYRDIERQAVEKLLAAPGNPRDIRSLLALLRMLPELERSGDLTEHIATRAARGVGREMTARSRGIVEQMGEVAARMWQVAADAYADRSENAHETVEALDDELDDLHVALTAEIASSQMSMPVAIDLVLIGRFYERLGDHAVNLARRTKAIAHQNP